MQNNILYVRIEPSYGRYNYYPACDQSRLFAALLGTKTFSDSARKIITQLGYEFKAEKELPL